MTVHVDLLRRDKNGNPQEPMVEAALLNALNHFLRERIGVVSARRVPRSFHARHSASMRTYVYRIQCGLGADAAIGDALLRADCCHSLARRGWISAHDAHRAYCIPGALDVGAMREAAGVLLGVHDFSSFRAAKCAAKSPMRELVELAIIEEPRSTLSAFMPECCRCLAVRVRSRSFLQHQVRYLVAAIVEAGRGKMSPAGMQALLDARNVCKAPPTGPVSWALPCLC